MLIPEEGFVFSFRKSEKLGTDCVRGFSDCILRLPELEFEAFTADLGVGTAKVRGVEDKEVLFTKSFLLWVFFEALSPKDVVSLNDLS